MLLRLSAQSVGVSKFFWENSSHVVIRGRLSFRAIGAAGAKIVCFLCVCVCMVVDIKLAINSLIITELLLLQCPSSWLVLKTENMNCICARNFYII